MPMTFVVNQMRRHEDQLREQARAQEELEKSKPQRPARKSQPRIEAHVILAAHRLREVGNGWADIAQELGTTTSGIRRAVLRTYGESKGRLKYRKEKSK